MNNIELKFLKMGTGYNLECQSTVAGRPSSFNINIPAFNSQAYSNYRRAYRELVKFESRAKSDWEILSVNVKTQEEHQRLLEEVKATSDNVVQELDLWTQLPELARIVAEINRVRELDDNFHVRISTRLDESDDLRLQPWHASRLLRDTEVVFSAIDSDPPDRLPRDKIRILVILGDTTGINIEEDRRAIERYCGEDAELKILPELNEDRQTREILTIEKLRVNLADSQGWDIIFFSGHSNSEGGTGRIDINATDSLTMEELIDVLQPAIKKRVQIFIFNSCDGLRITPVLERLNIDRLIVMREPIPNLVAQPFLKNFLRAFTRGAGFDDAVKVARQQLEVLEDRYPTASWLPIVIQNRFVPSLTWHSLGKNRQDLERIGELEAVAMKWDKNKRSQDNLLRGKELKEARQFASKPDLVIDFPRIVDEFLVASNRQRQWNKRWINGGLVLIGMISSFAWYQSNLRKEAEEKSVDPLVKDAQRFLDRGQTLKALVEAIKAGKVMQIKRASDPNVTYILQSAFDRATQKFPILTGHQNPVMSVSFSPDGKTLAFGSLDKTIRLWDVATGKYRNLTGHLAPVNSVSFSPDGKTLASGSLDGTVRLWTTGKYRNLTGHLAPVNSVSFSPDGKTLASGSLDSTVRLWNVVTTGERTKTLIGDQNFDIDNKKLGGAGSLTLAVAAFKKGSNNKKIRLFGAALLAATLKNGVNSVSFSRDGKTLASGSLDGTVRLWTVATGKYHNLTGHQGPVNSVSFSPDGKTLASGSLDGTVRLWTVATGNYLNLTGDQSPVMSVSFSPDGKTLASGSLDGTIKLWDVVTTGERPKTLIGHQGPVNSVSFSRDGKTLASGSLDGTIKLWRIGEVDDWSFDALMERSCDRARAYLENSRDVSQTDKHLCDGIGTKK